MRKPRSDAIERRRRITDYAASGLTAKEIAKVVRVTLDTVYRHLAEAGVSAAKPERVSPLSNVERVRAVVAKHGVARAATKFGVSRQAVYMRLKQMAG